MRASGYLLFLLPLIAACAASPDGVSRPLTGTAGAVSWEVIDIGRLERADGMQMRWSYTVVLRETAGTAVQFERLERGAHSPNLATGGIGRREFNRRLEARSELRDSAVDTWGWLSSAGMQFGGMSRLGNLTVERRYVGKNAKGEAVVVPVRVELHPGFGRRSRQPVGQEQPLPPARSLQPSDLAGLAGRWEGYAQTGAFQVPIEVTIREDGSAEIAENDPITNRFRRSLAIRDGRLVQVGQDSAELMLHQEGQTRMLVGRYTLAPSGSAPPEVLPLRLVWTGSPISAATAASGASPPTATAAASPSPPPAIAATPPGPVSGTYRGTVSGDQQGRPYTAQITLTLAQLGEQITGTWLTVGGAAGTVRARLVSPSRAELQVEQLHPCAAQFTGAATIGEGGASLGGSYTGIGCVGRVSTSFTVVRQP